MRRGKIQPLDLDDTLALKGFAILAIVFHNFYHRLPPVKENELAFDPDHFPVFLAHVIHPTESFQACFAYLGHFGVQVFIFLSAFGLAMKYYPVEIPWTTFLWTRVKKIYPMYFLAVLLWIAYLGLAQGPAGMAEVVRNNAAKLILTALGIINWVPHLGLPPIGPWWFLPFIIQFYWVWPWLARFSQRFQLKGLVALAVCSLALSSLIRPILFSKWEINLQLSPLGHLPEICLGIAMARFGVQIMPVHAVCAAALFVLGNIYYPAWLVTFVTALMLSLSAFQIIRPFARRSKILAAVGAVSMPVFFINGIVRIPLLEIAGRHAGEWLIVLVLGLISASLSLGIAFLLAKLDRESEGILAGRATGWLDPRAPLDARRRGP